MSTVNLKYSWFHAQNGEKKSMRLYRRYWKKIESLNSILINSERFGIKLPEETIKEIQLKKSHYGSQYTKLWQFNNMWKQKNKNEALKHIEKYFSKEELGKSKTEGGILKMIRKIF